jgi:hypothetical protein
MSDPEVAGPCIPAKRENTWQATRVAGAVVHGGSTIATYGTEHECSAY